jgi:hypothetical protein
MDRNTTAQASDRPANPPKRRGRPPGASGPRLPPEQRKSATIRVRATAEQAEAFEALLGGAWLRDQVDRAIRRNARQ